MSAFEIATLVLSIVTLILIPLVVFLIRGAIKWTRVESKLDNVVSELREIVNDKDKVHLEIYAQMREDRAATDRRLRWLEEHLWRRPNPNNAA